MLKCYIYDKNGMHGAPLYIEDTPEAIANFIWFNHDNVCFITTLEDMFIASSTEGGFLDRVASPALRDEILIEILPLQLGDKEAYNPVIHRGKIC